MPNNRRCAYSLWRRSNWSLECFVIIETRLPLHTWELMVSLYAFLSIPLSSPHAEAESAGFGFLTHFQWLLYETLKCYNIQAYLPQFSDCLKMLRVLGRTQIVVWIVVLWYLPLFHAVFVFARKLHTGFMNKRRTFRLISFSASLLDFIRLNALLKSINRTTMA